MWKYCGCGKVILVAILPPKSEAPVVKGECHNMEKTVFIVDDNEINLSVAKDALKDQYRVMTMLSAEKMFTLLEKRTPDLILLDIEMPDMNGFDALTKLKASSAHANIPVIFLTGMNNSAIEVRGFQLGVIDFITKPFSVPVLTNRLKTHLDIDGLIRQRTEQLQHKTDQLQMLQNGLLFVLADLVENRDKVTGEHIGRTSAYLEILLTQMKEKGVYADELETMDFDLIISSARLHDIGKITISDVILNKPDKLTTEEFELMKTHCEEGEHIIDQIICRTEDMEFLQNARLFAGVHHERWDGKGYPRGLAEENIPVLGRVMAIVDVFDALVSERPYKKAFEPDKAISIIMENSGTQFDPLIVEVFFEARELFKAVTANGIALDKCVR